MQPPCEMMVNDFLPNIRGLVSHELHEKGESQRRIATLLGITQARVSYYLSKKKNQFSNALTVDFGLSQSDIQNYGKILAEDVTRSQTDCIFTLYSIWKNLLFSGAICASHKKKSDVPADCAVCMELHKPMRESVEASDQETEDMSIIREISKAVAMVESSVHFPDIMPEVSVNVAMSRNSPKTSRDIAAVPGRINRIHGRAKAFVLPEFGSSNHMSRVLLIANSRRSGLRAAMNIKYDAIVDRALTDLELPRTFTETAKSSRRSQLIGARDDSDPVLNRLSLTRFPPNLDAPVLALIDRGSEGVEPITYLIGRNATDVAHAAIKIAHFHAASQS